jgi:site-specific recombinase XerD
MERLEELVDGFERSMIREERSPATIKSYRWAVDDLVRFLAGQGITYPSELTRALLEAWQDTLHPRMKARSRSLAATAARQFLRWAADRDLVDLKLILAIARVRTHRLLPRPIPPADLARIKAYLAPRRPRMAVRALRDRALFFYLLSTGARVSEVLQVTRKEASHAIVWQKGGSQKVLMAPPVALAAVDDFLAARKDDCPWLWVTYDNNRELRKLTPDGVREIWKRVARKVGVPRWTTHQLRHTCATELLEAGLPEIVVAEHLGHHGLGSITNYAQVRHAQRQQAVDAMQTFLGDAEAPRVIHRIRR